MAQRAYRLCFGFLSLAVALLAVDACSSARATGPQPAAAAGAGGDDATPGSAGTHQASEGGAPSMGGADGGAGAHTGGGAGVAGAGGDGGGGSSGGEGGATGGAVGSGGEGGATGGAVGSGGEGGADGGSPPCSLDEAPAIHSVDAYVTPTSQLLIRGKNLAEVSVVTAIDSDQQSYKCFFKPQDVTATSIRCDFGNAIPLSDDANDYYTIDVFTERCGHAPDPPWFEVVAQLP